MRVALGAASLECCISLCPEVYFQAATILCTADPGHVFVCSEDEVVRKEGMVQRLKSRLPSKSAARLNHLDSDSIINLYNHHVLSNRGCLD